MKDCVQMDNIKTTDFCWCPVKTGTFSLVDANLERVEELTLNILAWLDKGYSIDDISEKIEYSPKVVQKAVEYWQKSRFVDADLHLTATGKQVLKNILCIKEFNQKENKGYLNLATGMFNVSERNDFAKNINSPSISYHYNYDILRNLDVGNSREAVISSYTSYFADFTEDELTDISVAFNQDKEVLYMPYRLKRIPELTETVKDPVAYLKRKFVVYSFDCQKPELDFFRKDLPEIVRLMDKYPADLFKEKKGAAIKEAYSWEQKYHNCSYNLDTITGKNVNKLPELTSNLPKDWKGPVLGIQDVFQDLDLKKIFSGWLITNLAEVRNIRKKDVYVYQPIGMDCLEEVPIEENKSEEGVA